jgi:hypothetical protein
MRAILVLGLFLGFVFAGCVDNESGPGSQRQRQLSGAVDERGRLLIHPEWAERAVPTTPEHDHTDPAQHEGLSTPNFQDVGWDPLITDYYGTTAAMHLCGATVENAERRLTAVHAWGTDIAFVLIDTTDLTKPTKVGELAMFNTNVYDLTLTPDMRYVVMGTYPNQNAMGPEQMPLDAARPPGAIGTWRDACTGKETFVMGPEASLPYAAGIVIVDIQNPRDPIVTDFYLFPVFGAHSVRVEVIDGRQIVLGTVLNLVHEISYYVFMELLETPVGARLIPLSVYYPPADYLGSGKVIGLADPVGGGHDAVMQKHPITGKWLAYLADGPNGLTILDISDLTRPTHLATWNDYGVLGSHAPPDPYVHSALPMPEVWDGKHYTFAGEECLSRRAGMPSCAVFTLDTTDPTNIKFVGAWALPVDVAWSTLLEYSTHYIGVWNRTLFITVYHAGLWAIDVSNEEALRTMPSIGAYLPVKKSPKPAADPSRIDSYPVLEFTPIVLDFDFAQDGTIILFDATSGVYTVRFDPSYPAPPPPPWPLGYNE